MGFLNCGRDMFLVILVLFILLVIVGAGDD